jgi:hypothetical protein
VPALMLESEPERSAARDFNDTACDQLGYTRAELLRRAPSPRPGP